MKLIELDDEEDDGEQVPEWLCSSEGPGDDGFAVTEDDDPSFPTLFCADEEERPLSELIRAASTNGQLSLQHNQWEVSSLAATSNLAMMIQRKKAVRPWEGQGVKVIGGGRLVEYLDGEPIPEAPCDDRDVYHWW